MRTSYRALLTDSTRLYFFAEDDFEAAYQGQRVAELKKKNLLDVVKMKDYYPNHWEDIECLPDEVLPTLSYSEVLSEWAGGWSLPSGINSIIRSRGKDGRVTEFVYKSGHHAYKRIEKLVQEENELLIITNEYLHHVGPSSYL